MTAIATMCFACAHYRGGGSCDAYPEGILDAYLLGADHRTPDYSERLDARDQPLTFELAPGREAELDAYEDWRIDMQSLAATLEQKSARRTFSEAEIRRDSRGRFSRINARVPSPLGARPSWGWSESGADAALDAAMEATLGMHERDRTRLGGTDDPILPGVEAGDLGAFLVDGERFIPVDSMGSGISQGYWAQDTQTGRRVYVKLCDMTRNQAQNEVFASELKGEAGMLRARTQLGAPVEGLRNSTVGAPRYVAVEHVDDNPELADDDLMMEDVGAAYAQYGETGDTKAVLVRELAEVNVQSVVDREVAVWVLSDADAHDANWVLARDADGEGHVVAIDHGFAFRGWAELDEEDDVPFGRNGLPSQEPGREPMSGGVVQAYLRTLGTDEEVLDALAAAVRRWRNVDVASTAARVYGDQEDPEDRRNAQRAAERVQRRVEAAVDTASSPSGLQVLLRRYRGRP